MTSNHKHPYQHGFGLALLALAIPLLWWVSSPSRSTAIEPSHFPFWHSALELFSVVVAMLVFITGYRAVLSARKGAVLLLGVAFFGVGLLDGLHLLSYAGMPDAVTPNSAQKSTYFWLSARLLAAFALLTYSLLPALPEVRAVTKRLSLVLMTLLVLAVAYVGLWWPDRVPQLFAEGTKLTPPRIRLEGLIIVLNLSTLAALWYRRVQLARECLMALGFAVSLSAMSEAFFIMHSVVDEDSAKVIGHVYMLFAYLYLFHATFNEALRRPLEHLDIQRRREKVTLNAAPDGVLWVDNRGQILMANPAMLNLSGYSPEHLVGKNVDIFLPTHLRARHADSMRDYFSAPHSRAMGNMDIKLMRQDGHMVPIDISLGYWEEGEERHAIAYIRDLTERKKFESSLQHQATHDELTGLPNRWLFRLELNQAVGRADRSGLRVAVIFLDLDYFKTVNDSFGHAAGDALLVLVGARIHDILRASDTLARLGGDEFAILLTELTAEEEAVSVATKLLVAMQAPFCLEGQDIYSGASMGISFYPDDAQDAATLLRFADMAMYQAKQAGRGAYACYSMEMDKRMHEDMRMHTRLKEALANGRIEVHYQPQISVANAAIVGVEALLRWHDSELGQVPPSRFIPVAEATGLILPLSEWVLERACEQLAVWTQAGRSLRVAVNISAHQFRRPDLSEIIQSAIERTGARADLLELEITESVAMANPAHANEQLSALVALGCSVALDDFGTGYSSLSYLKTLPVSVLKIDQSFMRGIPNDTDDIAISRAIIALAHSLGMTLVAEGVETGFQLDFLRQNGCEVYQGWLYSKAVCVEVLDGLLDAENALFVCAG